MAQAGRYVKHYHADNKRFADNGFIDAINTKDQKITFCGVGPHHQNGIIENKNIMLTLGARTLLLHGMRMWSTTIDSMFWLFNMKAVAERHKKIQIDVMRRTNESILQNVQIEDIPVNSYHTFFCPTYVLDARLQNSGGAGPPKWEPRSRIGVYLGHSPLHAGNIAVVWNPTTVRLSPQYHVVFDDDFTTVPFMEASTLPPNWEDLVEQSCETATAEDIELADNWISAVANVGADKDQLSDLFAIVTDPTKRQKTAQSVPRKTLQFRALPYRIPREIIQRLEPACSLSRKIVAGIPSSNIMRTGALRDVFGSNPSTI